MELTNKTKRLIENYASWVAEQFKNAITDKQSDIKKQ